MPQYPRWRVDVTVGNDLVKTTYEIATTAKSAIGKAKQKLRGAVSSVGRVKFKAAKVEAGASEHHHATKKKSSAQLDREIAEALAQTHGTQQAKDFRVVVWGEPGRKPIHVSPWMTKAQADHAQKNHRAMNKERGHDDYEVVIEPRWMVEERERDGRRKQTSRSHATMKAAPRDWTARQMTSGRRVVEKGHGEKIARIFQGEGYWTVTINRREPREPFETTGEIIRQSAKTLAAAKRLGTRLLKG